MYDELIDQNVEALLSGLGATEDQKATIRTAIAKSQQNPRKVLTRGQEIFLQKANRSLPEDLQARLAKGELRVQDGEHYIRALVAGTGDIANETSTRAIGICTLDKFQFKGNNFMLVEAISLRCSPSQDAATVVTSDFTSAMPASIPALTNGDLEIQIDGKVVFRRSIASMLLEGNQLAVEDNRLKLANPIFIEPGKQIRVRLELPSGTYAAVSKYTFVEVAFYGPESVSA